jgi:hypothetical protein
MIVRLLNRRIGPGRNERRHQHRLLRPGRSRANPDAQRKIGPGDVGGGERSALPDDGRGARMLALFPAVPGRSADQPDRGQRSEQTRLHQFSRAPENAAKPPPQFVGARSANFGISTSKVPPSSSTIR